MAKEIETTITFLQMTEPPRSVIPLLPHEPVAILKAEAPPVHFYRYMLKTVGADYHWEARQSLSDADIKALLKDDKLEIHILYYAGWPAGFCESCDTDDNAVEIKFFGLVPECIGRGLGTYFLNQILHLLWSKGTDKITLQTCDLDHPHALILYQKFGFEPYGQSVKTLRID